MALIDPSQKIASLQKIRKDKAYKRKNIKNNYLVVIGHRGADTLVHFGAETAAGRPCQTGVNEQGFFFRGQLIEKLIDGFVHSTFLNFEVHF